MAIRPTVLPAFAVFAAAARHQNFAHAAEELHLTASAVSHHVRRLETTLGVTLFQRHARGVALTAQGRVLADATNAALADLDAVSGSLLSRDHEVARVRVTTLHSLAYVGSFRACRVHRHAPERAAGFRDLDRAGAVRRCRPGPRHPARPRTVARADGALPDGRCAVSGCLADARRPAAGYQCSAYSTAAAHLGSRAAGMGRLVPRGRCAAGEPARRALVTDSTARCSQPFAAWVWRLRACTSLRRTSSGKS